MSYRRILLTVEYDGTDFSGWQRQPGVRTVQGTLEDALSTLLGEETHVTGVSRTDAGVHALGQRVLLEGDFGIPSDRIPMALNGILRGRSLRPSKNSSIRVVKANEVTEDFSLRGDSKGKEYRYLIWNAPETDVFRRNRTYWVKKPLDINKMRDAASHIPGTKDFSSFQAAGADPDIDTVKTIYSLKVDEVPDINMGAILNPGADAADENGKLILITVRGSGFLYNMVRIIAGTLVEAGEGKMAPEAIEGIIDARDRTLAGHTAPPQGLYLVKVFYDDSILDNK